MAHTICMLLNERVKRVRSFAKCAVERVRCTSTELDDICGIAFHAV